MPCHCDSSQPSSWANLAALLGQCCCRGPGAGSGQARRRKHGKRAQRASSEPACNITTAVLSVKSHCCTSSWFGLNFPSKVAWLERPAIRYSQRQRCDRNMSSWKAVWLLACESWLVQPQQLMVTSLLLIRVLSTTSRCPHKHSGDLPAGLHSHWGKIRFQNNKNITLSAQGGGGITSPGGVQGRFRHCVVL